MTWCDITEAMISHDMTITMLAVAIAMICAVCGQRDLCSARSFPKNGWDFGKFNYFYYYFVFIVTINALLKS